jgi:hypothetical protein
MRTARRGGLCHKGLSHKWFGGRDESPQGLKPLVFAHSFGTAPDRSQDRFRRALTRGIHEMSSRERQALPASV